MRGEELDFEAAKEKAESNGDNNSATAQSALAAFVTIPLVFLIVVMASLAVFGKPGGGEKASRSAASAAVKDELEQPPLYDGVAGVQAASYAQDPAALGLAPDTVISAMSLDGDRLAIEADGEIILYDLRSGAILQRIKVHSTVSVTDGLVNAQTPQEAPEVSLVSNGFELTAPSLNPKR